MSAEMGSGRLGTVLRAGGSASPVLELQTVAAAADSEQMARAGRIVLELRPETGDEVVDSAGARVGVVTPDDI